MPAPPPPTPPHPPGPSPSPSPASHRRRSSTAVPTTAPASGPAALTSVVAVGVAVLFAVLLGACSGGSSGPEAGPPGTGAVAANATVVRHVDGDTVVVRRDGVEDRVRLIGIDTPETKKPDTPVECFGPEASERLHELLPDGTAVRLERDAEERDQYGRLLAYVIRADDGLFVNRSLAEDGYADSLAIKPNTAHAGEIGEAVARARRERRGLWAVCATAHAAAPARAPP